MRERFYSLVILGASAVISLSAAAVSLAVAMTARARMDRDAVTAQDLATVKTRLHVAEATVDALGRLLDTWTPRIDALPLPPVPEESKEQGP